MSPLLFSSKKTPLFSFFIFLFCLTFTFPQIQANKALNAKLKASWAFTPLHLESSEVAAKHGDFWSFVEKLEDKLENKTEQEQYQIFTNIGKSFDWSDELIKLLELRYFSPKIEMYRQLFKTTHEQKEIPKECQWSFAELKTESGTLYFCQSDFETKIVPKIKENKINSLSETFEFDHIYHSRSENFVQDTVTIILNAEIGTRSFYSFHKTLVAQARNGHLNYILRHHFPSTSSAEPRRISVAGWGAELALKNMEYKALDDTKPIVDEGGNNEEGKNLEEEDGKEEQDINGFYFKQLMKRRASLKSELSTFRDQLSSSVENLENLHLWQLKNVGYQAVQRILGSSEPLQLLSELSCNFPNILPQLIHDSVNKTLKETFQTQVLQNLPQGVETALLINGVPRDPKTLTLFELYKVGFEAQNKYQQLKRFGLSDQSVQNLLSQRIKYPSVSSFSFDINSDKILYMNDLEEDPIYSSWPRTLKTLLKPNWPGQPYFLSRNVITTVIVLNPLSLFPSVSSSINEAMELIRGLQFALNQNIPVRFGFLLTTLPSTKNDEESEEHRAKLEDISAKLIRIYLHLHEISPRVAFTYFASLVMNVYSEHQGSQRPVFEIFEEGDIFEATLREVKSRRKAINVNEALQVMFDPNQYSDIIQQTNRYVIQKGLSDRLPSIFSNGILCESTSADEMIYTSLGQYPELIEMVRSGVLRDSDDDLYQTILKHKSAISSLNPDIFVSPTTNPLISVSLRTDFDLQSESLDVQNWPNLKQEEKNLLLLENILYLSSPSGRDNVKEQTFIVPFDASDLDSVNVLRTLIQWLEKDSPETHKVRIGLLPQRLSYISSFFSTSSSYFSKTQRETLNQEFVVERAIQTAFSSSQLSSRAFAFLLALLDKLSTDGKKTHATTFSLADLEPLVKQHLKADKFWNQWNGKESSTPKKRDTVDTLYINSRFFYEQITPHLSASDKQVLIINGRILKIKNAQTVNEEFIRLVVLFHSKVLESVHSSLFTDQFSFVSGYSDRHSERDYLSDGILQVLSLLNGQVDSVSTPRYYQPISASHFSQVPRQLHLGGTPKTDEVFLEILLVLNPISTEAQKLAPILKRFVQHFGRSVSLEVIFNIREEYSSVPLQKFYRFLTEQPISFDQNGLIEDTAALQFTNLPGSRLLTLGMDVPEGWFVESVMSSYDLDNIKLDLLGDGPRTLFTEFDLTQLLIEGNCFDRKLGEHPQGLELSLINYIPPEQEGQNAVQETVIGDTIAMINLGYFQLKAGPGLYYVNLGKGASRTIYQITQKSSSSSNLKSQKDIRVLAVVDSFDGVQVPLNVEKRVGFEHARLLQYNQDEANKGQASGWFSNMFGLSEPDEKSSSVVSPNKNKIHIFSVASGHLYERFLKIMILSVLNHTKSEVKFWFVKNFLSPKFKEFIPQMAKKYNFQFELVTYKWPHWLRQQTEKQRIIWGYKILFLDVLFPLDVDRVIFVDADQIVRSDLKELYEMDIQGAPYAYTPFCTSRTEMDGFRFWNEGYWRSHLSGKPYHISALYLVDLKRFREIAAGDRIRSNYDGLSRDPNSLANLDQDLPNYLQHSIPIFSLPQDWLWCETWCSDESKPRAKTIDLCNNPLTKTPKLENAMRIVPEWVAYDTEAKRLETELESEDELSVSTSTSQTKSSTAAAGASSSSSTKKKHGDEL